MRLIGSDVRTRHPGASAEHNEVWLVSYADMMTLLFGFFVILYSLSQLDETKMQVVGKQLAEAFGSEKAKEKSNLGQPGMQLEARHLRALQLLIAMLNLGDNLEDAVGNIEKKAAESKGMEAARDVLMQDLKTKDDGTLQALKTSVQNRTDSIDIALPDSLFFDAGTADLTPRARLALKRIAESLNKVRGLVGVEISGHTDASPPSRFAKFNNNWALSSARAGAVAAILIDYGLEPKNLVTRGMASLQPLFPERREDGTLIPENASKNRRVQITVKKVRSVNK